MAGHKSKKQLNKEVVLVFAPQLVVCVAYINVTIYSLATKLKLGLLKTMHLSVD